MTPPKSCKPMAGSIKSRPSLINGQSILRGHLGSRSSTQPPLQARHPRRVYHQRYKHATHTPRCQPPCHQVLIVETSSKEPSWHSEKEVPKQYLGGGGTVRNMVPIQVLFRYPNYLGVLFHKYY